MNLLKITRLLGSRLKNLQIIFLSGNDFLHLLYNQIKQNNMKNLFCFLGFLACMLIALFTASGDIQKFIHFSGVANEMAFCFLAFMMAAVFMLSAILPDEKKKNKRNHGFE
jgi:cytosine/uracil/thiamine/allantoin permease